MKTTTHINAKIGEMRNGTPVRISSKSPNQSIAIFGKCGSGKSTKSRAIIYDKVENCETIIAFDLDGKSYDMTGEHINRISVLHEGINLRLFNKSGLKKGTGEYVNFVSQITGILSGVANFGVRQQGALRVAIEFAIEHGDKFESEMEAIAEGLKMQESTVAEGVYNKLWGILCSDIFRKSSKRIELNKINVFSFEGISVDLQKVGIELILGNLWQNMRSQKISENRITIAIDEFQNLSLKKNSVLMDMLREARKYNVSFVLSTQSTNVFSKEVAEAIHQTAVQLYFQPSAREVKKVAELIAPNEQERWTLILNNLEVGESVAVGTFNIGGKEFVRPLVVRENVPSNALVSRK